MATANDPVGSGLVESLARPGGNTTGLSNLSTDLSPKLVELLLAIAPTVSRFAMLVNPKNATHAVILDSLKAAAATIRVGAVPAWAATGAEMENAFSTINVEKAGAIIVAADAVFVQQRHQIAELAIKYRLPTIFAFREHVEAGGLMSYGQDISENYRRSASYVDKIFKGAKPADLPVEQTTKIEMLINGKTAKALGLTIPTDLLVLATEVIE
jgi:putative tryptophan/tyrosine transport system substrate-binding protein